MASRLYLLGALFTLPVATVAGPAIGGNWASHLAPGEVDQICQLAADQHNLPAIKVQAFIGQAGYVDHEGDPPRHIVFANVFFAAEEEHQRYNSGKVVGLEKKEAAGPEGWAVEGKPGKWLQINAPSNHKQPTPWYSEPFCWDPAVRISDAISIVDLAYRETFEAKKEELNPIPREFASEPISAITFETPQNHNRLLLELSDNFIAFLKTEHRWKKDGIGYSTASVTRLRPISANMISPRPLAARWARR
jgi:hypothetical protein